MSHLGPSLLFMQHVLSSLKFPSTFGFFNIISLSHYPCINWLTGELNLKSQNLFLLQIFWVVLISHFVPDFIQVCDLPFFFFNSYLSLCPCTTRHQTKHWSKPDFNYCREARRSVQSFAYSPTWHLNCCIWSQKYAVERAPAVVGKAGVQCPGWPTCPGRFGASHFTVLASWSLQEDSWERLLTFLSVCVSLY